MRKIEIIEHNFTKTYQNKHFWYKIARIIMFYGNLLHDEERQSFIKDLRKINFYLTLNVESLITQPQVTACKLMC